PQPPDAWPEENVALLERYLLWLYADNASLVSIQSFYLPIAGHILGYHLQSHTKLDLAAGFQPVLDYLQAKQVSQRWLEMAHRAHSRFRRFCTRNEDMPNCRTHCKTSPRVSSGTKKHCQSGSSTSSANTSRFGRPTGDRRG